MKQDRFKNSILPLADKLFRLALSITRNKQDAEDVVQDAMLKVWQKEEEWDSINNLEGYCFRSTRNIALDKISLMDNQQHERIHLLFDFPEPTNGSDAMDKEEQLSLIFELVKRLPEKQRTIFQLRDIEEKSYKEIAEIMEITEDQVKVNLFRARQKIKNQFKSVDK